MYNVHNNFKEGITMKLPNKFSFRLRSNPGFTHSAKVEGDVVKVKWARGWANEIDEVPWGETYKYEVEGCVSDGGWVIAEEGKKPSKYPDVFHFINTIGGNAKHTMTRDGDEWRCWHYGNIGQEGAGGRYSEPEISYRFCNGWWTLYEPKQLTAEQVRRNKEINEKLAQLDSSIKIAEQNIEHNNRLIRSYEERKEVLKKGLVEE
jgi:hypothetical protein